MHATKEDKPGIIVILGPTASGKSTLAIDLALKTGAQIVNADSLQVYKFMDTGTAKPSMAERRGVAHHLMDIVMPDEEFNAGSFRGRAEHAIFDLDRRNIKIIVVGGTYLYIRVLLSGLIENAPRKDELRDELKSIRDLYGTASLHEKLQTLDPEAASKIHPNDYVRIERALEVNYLTGKKMSELQSDHEFSDNRFRYLKIGIDTDREILYENINSRVDSMIAGGLVDEVRGLRKMGYGASLKPMQSIGYKEINNYIDGQISIEDAAELIKRDTRRLAKRQLTWLRSDSEINWFNKEKDFESIYNLAEKHLS